MTTTDPRLARAMLWRWAAAAMWYPDAAFLAELREPTARRELDVWAKLVDHGPVAAMLGSVWETVDRLPESPGLAEEYTYLFARKVLVSPRESAYLGAQAADRSRAFADLGALYAAFGFQVAEARPELPDHVCAQCEFYAVLLLKEVYAEAQGWEERAELTAKARSAFLEEHLAQWLPSFAERLAERARLPFYQAVAALLVGLVHAERAASAQVASVVASAARRSEQARP